MVTEKYLTVLIVEDHQALREVLTEILESYGHTVIGVDCAEEVCELLPQQGFDAAILDLNLPGEDGLSLAERLRQVQPDLIIIMVTARNQVADKLSGYRHGADIYLSKPVDGEELALLLQALAKRLHFFDNEITEGYRLDRQCSTLILPTQNSVLLTVDEVTFLQALALAVNQSLEYWQLLEVMGREVNNHGKKQLEVIVSRLRRKLKNQGIINPVIRATRSKGYQLLIPLRLN
ncbi:DNA-binding response regulator, OmpR family, contains REC and winged-helix (wHTH) domain [Ectothiorhodospira magna]|uniref:DNA-binding response regulator, OmpR family, contains REC and winged-helix (WHTH) domain n=1 Tax=Ectothiorhodospira magna TaxID=867345 RepID=A0A1H9BU41_9GAMM|nr:response regulator transcription factor [Ectothiorhodospira magna]SEP91818.1 DNA-binding response regulator, OmpR family, contains REC and winged-helix (wHTH) domain [Ectothiorhodospira magna]